MDNMTVGSKRLAVMLKKGDPHAPSTREELAKIDSAGQKVTGKTAFGPVYDKVFTALASPDKKNKERAAPYQPAVVEDVQGR